MSALPRRVAPQAPARRGWCPSLMRPMPSGDGLLARVHPRLGILSAAQLRALAEAARRYGNGHLDVTARGNIQIRGVRDADVCALADRLAAAGLGDTRSDGGPQRVTLTSPLAGLDPSEAVDGLALARTIEDAALAVAGLPAKTLVAIAGRGCAGAEADILVSPEADGRLAIALAPPDDAGAVTAIVASPDEAAGAVAAMLSAFAASGARRVRDLATADRARVTTAGRRAVSAPPRDGGACSVAQAALPAGLSPLGRHWIVCVEAPFGRCTTEGLDRLAEAADLCAADIRTSASRGFVLPVRDEAAAREALRLLAETGFVTGGDDPRRAVAACPGGPACASGETPASADAARLADAFRGFAARGLRAHVSGCAKGCAHPGPSDLTLVGEAGGYGIVLGGPASASPRAHLSFEAALERVRRAAPAEPLADVFKVPT